MGSSLSIKRLERELSPEARRNSVKRFQSPNEDPPQKSTEEVLHALTLNEDQEVEVLEALESERLPGSCKSLYALQFRL